jgi:hypothetical protein
VPLTRGHLADHQSTKEMHMAATKMPVVKKNSSKKKLTPAQAERKMMATAQKCRIVIELSDEQMAAYCKAILFAEPGRGYGIDLHA